MQRVRLPLENLRVDGAKLFRIRTGAGITQASVAERAKISDHWYRRIERWGQQPSRPVAESIAEALGCALNDFCDPIDPTTARDAA